ncbi:phage minor tail protein L [Salinicola salarius]|uniref:phage minor tail protein L n=1 Tax=Salinicola salarius TaxID=430457 RepID=UPI000DA20BE5|nr:phage minor tail protein L [Salinicola salarius]
MNEIIARESQSMSQQPVVTLFEIDARQWEAGILRFTNQTALDGGPIRFNGYTYTPTPITADGFEWNGKGTLPQPSLSLSTLEVSIVSMLLATNDLIGAPVKRIRTFANHLDGGDDPDPEATFPVDEYHIEQKPQEIPARGSLEFTLSISLDQQGRKIPARQCLRDTCTHTYRYWNGSRFVYEGVTCPYTGAAMFDQQGVATDDETKDVCGKCLSDCRARFGANNPLPTRAMPGLARYKS